MYTESNKKMATQIRFLDTNFKELNDKTDNLKASILGEEKYELDKLYDSIKNIDAQIQQLKNETKIEHSDIRLKHARISMFDELFKKV